MDEVKAMSRAGENMGKAVGTGVRTARHGATRAGKRGAEISRQATLLAEQELASRGISTDDLQERLAQRATGMSRKELAKRGKKARKQWEKSARPRKQLAKNAKAARKELAGRLEPAPKSRRKWPWVLLVLAGLAAAAAAALSRRPEELPVVDAEHDRFPSRDAEGKPTNGSEPLSDGQVSGKPTALDKDKER